MLKIKPHKVLLTTVLLVTSFWLTVAFAQALDPSELLSAEEAFATTASVNEDQRITIHWDIAEGYYLYRHSLKFSSDTEGITLAEAQIPVGKQYTDEFFGEVETYRDELAVLIPVTAGTGDFDITFTYQGCADLGVCYPPERKALTLNLPTGTDFALSAGAPVENNTLLLPGLNPASDNTIVFADDALPAEQAFQYEAIALDGNQLLVRMTAADGYYLYRDKFDFSVEHPSVRIAQFNLPAGAEHHDEHFGAVEIYYDQVEIPVQLNRSQSETAEITLTGYFQGCKAEGICYPPMKRFLTVNIPAGDVTSPAPLNADSGVINSQDNVSGQTVNQPIVTEQDRLAAILTGTPLKAMLLFFIAGLLLAFTPCVFPMIPILSGIIAGQGDTITTRKALILSLVYVLAMALTYTAAGVFAGLFGSNLQAAFQNPWIISAFSLMFIGLAFSMFGFYELQVPSAIQTRLSMLSNKQQGGSLLGVAVMGILSALIVGPCVAPALAAALIYIGQTGDALLGGLALFALALGMGIPLIIFGVSAGSILPRAGAWMNAVKYFFGVGLLALALWMVERILPAELMLLLWGTLLIGTGVFMGALDTAAFGWQRLWKALGVVLLAYGVMQLAGFASGGNDWTRPLRGLGFAQSDTADIRHFQNIKSLGDLQAQLGNGPVMLDFYADWCIECKRMEKYTFPEADVQQALQNVTLIQADVTRVDALDKQLLQHFNLIGPPAILFFDANGNEIKNRRIIGYLNADEFTEHVTNTY